MSTYKHIGAFCFAMVLLKACIGEAPLWGVLLALCMLVALYWVCDRLKEFIR